MCMNVLSCLIDKAMEEKKIGYHSKFKNIQMTYLCFADDLMVFIDGTKRSIEGVLRVFDEFASMSGLKINLENSTLYLAGVSD